MKDIDRIMKRVEKNGFAYTNSDREICSKISKIPDLEVFGNRRLKKSIIVDKNKIKIF